MQAFPGFNYSQVLELYAVTFFILLEQAGLIEIEKRLEEMQPEDRFQEEARLQNLGYNVGQRHANETENIKRMFNGR